MSVLETNTAGVRAWTVGRVDDIPLGEGRALVAGETPVAVFRLRDGSLHATQAACPHAGGPLADGQTDASVLVCPLHLYAFRWRDGGCTSADLALRTYPVRDVDGALVIDA
jgi:nitrite reductase (NADH) small subunit